MLENKVLIILEGPSQSGKTISIRHLATMLIKQHQSQTYKSKKWKECLEVHLLNGKKVGLTSRSDKFPVFKENFEFLANEMGCELIVCALNSKTKGVEDFISLLKNNNWTITYVHKHPEFYNRIQKDMQALLNSRAAIFLLEKLNEKIFDQVAQ
jgi:hypothetical protein